MIHFNEVVKQERPLVWMSWYFTKPEIYVAQSVRDFTDSRHDLVPTKRVFPPASKYNGLVGIAFQNAITLEPKIMYKIIKEKKSLMVFPFTMSDICGNFPINFYPRNKVEFDMFADNFFSRRNLRLYNVAALYNPKSDNLSLVYFSFNNDFPVADEPEEVCSFERPAFQF